MCVIGVEVGLWSLRTNSPNLPLFLRFSNCWTISTSAGPAMWMWSMEQQRHQKYVGACYKRRLSGPHLRPTNQNLHFNETPKGFVWTTHTKKCGRRRSLRRRCRLPHLGLWRPVSSLSPPHLYSPGALKRQVPIEKRSPETSSLFLPPCSPLDSGLPLHPAAPRTTCSGSLQAVLRLAFRVRSTFTLRRLRCTHWPEQ